jgi:uncharacterized membrane-anchored protein
MITVSNPVYLLITGLIPLLTGLVTKINLNGQWKGLITLFLNSVLAFLTANVVKGSDFAAFSWQTLVTAFVGFAISVSTYQAVWSKTRLTSSKPDSLLLPNFGIGKAEPSE